MGTNTPRFWMIGIGVFESAGYQAAVAILRLREES